VKEKELQRLDALLRYERELLQKGYRIVGGIDEAGRGPLAGPVVAACVVMPADGCIEGVDDSKKISEAKREKLYEEIIKTAISYGVGVVYNQEIDTINILNASKRAFQIAYKNMGKTCDYVLIDGRDKIELPCDVEAVIGGDAKCYSIAAASILAKVYRDRLMRRLDAEYPDYCFAKNKGYGTKEHTDALLKHGYCAIHRRTFIKNYYPMD
jgi:ribonuclease HII